MATLVSDAYTLAGTDEPSPISGCVRYPAGVQDVQGTGGLYVVPFVGCDPYLSHMDGAVGADPSSLVWSAHVSGDAGCTPCPAPEPWANATTSSGPSAWHNESDPTPRDCIQVNLEQRLWYAQDEQRSVYGLVDQAGELQEGYEYDPYGRTLVFQPGSLLGEVTWTSSDIITGPDEAENPYNPNSLGNGYAYVSNAANEAVDPLGTKKCKPWQAKCLAAKAWEKSQQLIYDSLLETTVGSIVAPVEDGISRALRDVHASIPDEALRIAELGAACAASIGIGIAAGLAVFIASTAASGGTAALILIVVGMATIVATVHTLMVFDDDPTLAAVEIACGLVGFTFGVSGPPGIYVGGRAAGGIGALA